MRFLMLNWRCPAHSKAGGAERVTLEYLAALAGRGHDVTWFSPRDADLPEVETLRGVHLVRGGGTLAARRWVKRQPKFDLVIDQIHGLPWFAPWWSGTKCVAYLHEVLGPIWSAFYPWPVSAVGRWQEQLMFKLYRRVPYFTASIDTKNALLRSGVRDVTIIPYGVHIEPLPALDDKPLTPPVRLVTCSRLEPNKRVDHAITAARELLDAGVAVRLTVIGGGSQLAQLTARKSEFPGGELEFTGAISEDRKNALLREAHFLIHPSMREGWGLNIIEANAMGTPSVVYPVAGLTEAVRHGVNGVVTDAETPAAIVAAVRQSLTDPAAYQQWRVAGRAMAATQHWRHVLPKACDWFEQRAAG